MEGNGITMEAWGACLLSQPWLICYCKSHFGTHKVSGHISLTVCEPALTHTHAHTYTLPGAAVSLQSKFTVKFSCAIIYIIILYISHAMYSRIYIILCIVLNCNISSQLCLHLRLFACNLLHCLKWPDNILLSADSEQAEKMHTRNDILTNQTISSLPLFIWTRLSGFST